MIIVIIIILLIVIAGPVYMYIRARQVVSVDVQALGVNEILEIGTKTSIPALRTVQRNVQVFHDPAQPAAVAWNARNGHVIVSYYAAPLPGSGGYRIAATARPQALVRGFNMRGFEKAINAKKGSEYLGGVVGSWLGQKIWLWSHARKVLFRRWRTFSALKQADQKQLAALTSGQPAATAGFSPESGASANGA